MLRAAAVSCPHPAVRPGLWRAGAQIRAVPQGLQAPVGDMGCVAGGWPFPHEDSCLAWLLCPGVTGDSLVVQRPVDLEALREPLKDLLAQGICSLAVVLLHSYA